MADNGTQPQPPGGEHDAPEGYEDLVRFDQGGFATVYRARDTRFDRTVALKVLRSDTLNERQLRRFRAECLATGRVSSHPNIVTVYDAGTTRGHRPWLAMEYCSGGSLAHKVAREGPLPVAEVMSIGTRLCSALTAAHEAGILHRDVKPHNVLLTSYGEPALADFGIASVVIEDDNITETAAYTVVHAAPEILEGKSGTTAADIYSLGSTLYTLLAGQAPFAKEASTGLAPLVTRILRNDLPAIDRPGVPPELEALLRRSMAAEPLDRPASAVELGIALTALGHRLDTERISARADPLPRSADMAPRGIASADLAPADVAPAHIGSADSVPRGMGSADIAPAAFADEEHDEQAQQVTHRRPPSSASRTVSSRRLLLIVGGTLGILLVAFTSWGLTHRGAGSGEVSPGALANKSSQAAAGYTPANVVVAQGSDAGELIVSWAMPKRPDVVATVVYEGTGAKARAMVNYETSPTAVPQATVRGLPSGRRVCLSAAHLVSHDHMISDEVSRPVCAVPR